LKEDVVAMDIKRFMRKVIMSSKMEALILEAHPAIARYIGENFLSQWVQEFKRAIFMVESKDLSWENIGSSFRERWIRRSIR